MPKEPKTPIALSQADDQPLPTLAGIQRAARELAQYLPPTPLFRSDLISDALGAEVWLKLETASPIASFKLRGALTAVLRAQGKDDISHVVASSTGNHGQAVAYAARMVGLPATIFLPHPGNPVKKRMILSFGATVKEVGETLEDARDAAITYCKKEGGLFLDDGENHDLMEGAGTVGLEMAQELPNLDWVLVPTGGGNLVCGTATSVKGLQPNVKIAAIQSDAAPALVESFIAKKSIPRPARTIADGLAVATPPEYARRAMLELVDEAWTVPEKDIPSAIHSLVESAHTLVEPSGAVGLAAAWARRENWRGRRLAIILTGANITTGQLLQALQSQPLFPSG